MKVSLISVSSPLLAEQIPLIDTGKAYLESLGIEIYSNNLSFNTEKKSAKIRAKEFMDAYLEHDSSFILSVRGGSGTIEILEHLDYESILNAKAKPILAYSDLTTLALAFSRKAQDLNLAPIPFFHSPMLFEMGKWLEPELKEAHLLNKQAFETFINSLKTGSYQTQDSGNSKEQKIIGANLSVLCSLLGTAYTPDFRAKVLFLEECNEPLYKMERMFYQLHLAGCFNKIEELWLGTSLDAELPMELLMELSRIHGFRLICDLPIGHGDLNFITPLF